MARRAHITVTRDPTGPLRRPRGHAGPMDAIQIGYARVSTADQDFTAQRDGLLRLGVLDANIYVDHGMTGASRARPGLREALAAVRSGDTRVVTKLDRLAKSLCDAREIADDLTAKHVALSIGGSRYDPTDPVGPTTVQRSRDGRGVRAGPHQHAHPRRDGSRTRERPAEG